MTTRMKITNQGPENAAIWYYGSDRMFKEQKDHLTPGQSVEVDIWDGHLPVLLPMGHTPPGVGESGKFFRCPPATYSSDAAAQPQQDEPDDDQEWDRNAERLTKEAFGLGGGINPNATSIDDLFLDDEPEPPNPALAKAAESHARLIQQDEPVAWGQLGLLNGKTYLRMNYDRTPYPPPADVVRNLNLVPLYADAQPQQANAEDEKVINVRPSEWAALSPEARGVLRRLVFAARTAGGTAGHDQGLTEACDAAEALLLVEAEKAAQPQQAAAKPVAQSVNRYCSAGMCVPSDKVHEPGCEANPPAAQPQQAEVHDHACSTHYHARARCDCAQPQQAAPCDEEIGWLIEHRAAEHTLWWSGEFCSADGEYRSARLIAKMSNDANNAVRFARKEDAQRVLDAMLAARPSPILARAPELYSVTEHMWTAAAQPPQD